MTFERAFFAVVGFLADALDLIVLTFAEKGLLSFFFAALAVDDFALTDLRNAAIERADFAFIDFTFAVFGFAFAALAVFAMFVSYPLSVSHPLVDRGLNSFSLLAVTSNGKVRP